MNKDDEIILDIVKAVGLIMEFTENMNIVQFLNDVKTQSSVLYQIVIIGEEKPLIDFHLNFLKLIPKFPLMLFGEYAIIANKPTK